MSLAVLYSRALSGMDAPEVVVEVHLANGLPMFTIVGLPEAEVKESKDRVRAAIQTAQFEFPMRRITVNLAPADLPKESGRYDLPPDFYQPMAGRFFRDSNVALVWRGVFSLRVHSGDYSFARGQIQIRTLTKDMLLPNHALQRTRHGVVVCNRCVPWAGSLSLGR